MSRGVSHRARLLGVLLAMLLAACSDSDSVQPAASIGAPTDVAVTSAEPDQAVLQWSAVPGAVSYNVYWSTTPDVTKETGTRIEGETSPCVMTGLAPGTTYYFVVTAVAANGAESRESVQVSIQLAEIPPDPPEIPAPTNVSAAVTEEAPNSITVQWDPVAVEGKVVRYNLYRGTASGTYDNVFYDTGSPFIDAEGILGRTTYFYAVTAWFQGGDVVVESDFSSEASATARGPVIPDVGPGEEGYGNNLSLPVVFADGIGVTGLPISGSWTFDNLSVIDFNTGLRPTAAESPPVFPYLDEATPYPDTEIYQQQTASTWQAQWHNAASDPRVDVLVDWGDNLGGSARLTTSMNLRVETVLYQDNTYGTGPTDAMLAFHMTYLTGSGPTEMQGTDGTTYDSNRRHVYTPLARLKIEKLDAEGGSPLCTVFDRAVHESQGEDGPGGYGAEVNVSGKLVYGYNFFVRQLDIAAYEGCEEQAVHGWYRLTFSLDESAEIGGGIGNHTYFVGLAPAESEGGNGTLVSETEARIEIQVQEAVTTVEASGGGGPGGGGGGPGGGGGGPPWER